MTTSADRAVHVAGRVPADRGRAAPARLARLAPLTFGVYLIHPVFLDLAQRAGLLRGGHGTAWTLPLLTAAVFALSAASSWLLRRHPATRRLV